MQALFERFRLLEAAWAGPRSAIFRSEFGRLCDQLSSVQAEAGVQERTAAPAFNIFYLLGVEGDEDKTHTPILADLLDPRGAHAQGFLFLREFLRCCSEDPTFEEPPEGYEKEVWIVDTQRFTPFGIIDLVISAPSIGYRIAVENKVYASEQVDQIRRYARWLRGHDAAYPRQHLVFLTPDGRQARSASNVRYVRVSYRTGILRMLQAALPDVKADRVRAVVSQYIETIQAMVHEESTDDN